MTQANVKKVEDGVFIVSKEVKVEIKCVNADEIAEAFQNIFELERLVPNGTEQESV